MKYILLLLIDFYRLAISPYFPSSCRYQPTCSSYAKQAIQRCGALRGSWLAFRRVLSCHPWSKGGHDPVPDCGTEQHP